MAISYIGARGTNKTTTSNTLVITVLANTKTGNTLIIPCHSYASHFPTAATDSRGNTYFIDIYKNYTGHSVALVHAFLNQALLIGDTVTITFNGHTTSYSNAAGLFEFSGLRNSVSSYGTGSTKTALSGTSVTSTTLTPSQSSSLFISAVSVNLTTTAFVAGTSWTRVWYVNHLTRSAAMSYYIASNITKRHESWSWTGSASNGMVNIANYNSLGGSIVLSRTASTSGTGTLSATAQLVLPVVGFVQSLGQGSSTTASVSVTVGANTTAGHTVLLVTSSNTTGNIPLSATDSKGNTYVVDSPRGGLDVRVSSGLIRGLLLTALTKTNTITVTFTKASTLNYVEAFEYAGLSKITSLDKIAINTFSNTSATITPTTKNDLFISVFIEKTSGATATPPTSWVKRWQVNAKQTSAAADYFATTNATRKATWSTTSSTTTTTILIAAYRISGA